VRVDKKAQGRMPGGLPPIVGGVWQENFLNFQVKNAGIYAFVLRKTILVARNWDQGA